MTGITASLFFFFFSISAAAVPEVPLGLEPSHYRGTAGGKVMHGDDFLRALAELTGQSR